MIFKTLGQLSEVGEIIEKINSLQNVSDYYDDIAKATENLSLKNTMLALSTSKISKEDAELILIAKGVEEEEIKQTLATYNLSASQMGATGTTFSLSSAFKGLTASIKSTIASIWAFIVSNPVGWIVGAISLVAGLGVAIVSINKLIEKHREEIIETGETAREEISQIKSELESMESSVEDAGKTFAELVDGIDTLNNTNISLSDEEYEDFIASSNELAELFPQLVVGLDAEGNAILDLGSNAEEATSKLNELIEAQRKLVAEETQEKLVDVFKGIHEETRDLGKELDNYQKERNSDHIKDYLITDMQGLGVGKNISLSEAYAYGVDSELLMNNAASIINDALGTDLKAEFNEMTNEWFVSTLEMTEEEYENAIEALYFNSDLLTQKALDSIDNSISDAKEEINTSYKKELISIFTALSDDDIYTNLSDTNKKLADTLISNLDYSEYRDEIKKDYNGDIVDFILNDELFDDLFEASDDKKVLIDEVYSNLLSIDPKNSVAENTKIIQEYIDELAELLEIDSEKLKVMLGYEFIDEDIARIERAKKMVTGDTVVVNNQNDANRRQSQIVVQEAIEELNDEDLSLLLSVGVPEGVYFETEKEFNDYMDKLRGNAKIDIEIVPPTITDTVDAIHNQLKPALDSLGTAYTNIFEDGFTLDNISTDEFIGIKNALDEMKESGLDVDYSEYEDFVKVLSDTSSTSDEVQEAFDSMATMMVNTSTAVNITEENFDLLKQQLEELGVTNAEEVLTDLKDIHQELRDASIDLTNVTVEEAAEFINSAEASDEAKEYLREYVLEKELASNPLNTTGDIEALEDVCEALGTTGSFYQELIRLKNEFYNFDTEGVTSGFGKAFNVGVQVAGNTKSALKDALDDEYNFVKDKFSVDFKTKKTGSSSGSSGDPYKEKFEQELKDLQWLRDMGVINEKEYLDRLRALNHKYFKDKAKYLEEYRTYEKEYYSGMISVMESVVSTVTDTIDENIKELEEQRTFIEEYYQKQIDELQAVIDSMQEENDEIDRNMQLQKAKYALARSIYQRTKLINFMSDIVVIQ